jgi:hypothetical protein
MDPKAYGELFSAASGPESPRILVRLVVLAVGSAAKDQD